MGEVFTESFWTTVWESVIHWLISAVPGILFILVLGWIAIRLIVVILRKTKKLIISRAEKRDEIDADETEKRINTLIGILRISCKIAIWTIVIMIVLKKLGIDIGPLLAGAGILGLAVGFGAQELVRDVISGFFMLLENQVRMGDVAIINGTGGLVESIGLRTVKLRDLSGTVHIFQNGKINTLANMTKDWSAMVFDIGVAYKEDADSVIRVIKEVGEKLQADPDYKELILEPLEVMGVDKFADSAVVIKARIKTTPINQWKVGREFNRRLKSAFDREKIEIPFPHRTIYWGDVETPVKIAGKGS
jgi:small-conductance mechanosensitive channel